MSLCIVTYTIAEDIELAVLYQFLAISHWLLAVSLDAGSSILLVEDEENAATGAEAVESQKSQVESMKFIENGQLFIIRDGIRYNAQGQVVK